jgi:hypothetical protein
VPIPSELAGCLLIQWASDEDREQVYGSPDDAGDVATRKISARLQGGAMASQELGV